MISSLQGREGIWSLRSHALKMEARMEVIDMAKERGWWSLDSGDQTMGDLDESDLDHIAKCIQQGFTSGEICKTEE